MFSPDFKKVSKYLTLTIIVFLGGGTLLIYTFLKANSDAGFALLFIIFVIAGYSYIAAQIFFALCFLGVLSYYIYTKLRDKKNK
jgi:hypothetical protein